MGEVKTLDRAFSILAVKQKRFPFDEIRYLREKATLVSEERIQEKIIHSLIHAYDGLGSDEVALYFAVVAEKHVSPRLIDPLIALFTTERDWSDFFELEEEYLLGKLAERYPEVVLQKVIKVLSHLIGKETYRCIDYLYSVLLSVDRKYLGKYMNKLLNLSKRRSPTQEYFVIYLVEAGVKEILPQVQKMLNKRRDEDEDRLCFREDFDTMAGRFHEQYCLPLSIEEISDNT